MFLVVVNANYFSWNYLKCLHTGTIGVPPPISSGNGARRERKSLAESLNAEKVGHETPFIAILFSYAFP